MTDRRLQGTEAGDSEIDIASILRMLPHRYPFLMVDRIVEFVPGVSAIGIKNVTINEPFFQGHFPNSPIMPGVMIIEAMAQTAATLVIKTVGPAAEGKLVYFMSVESARFRKPVFPGDTLRLHVTKQHNRGVVWKFSAVAMVEKRLVADARYTAMILDK